VVSSRENVGLLSDQQQRCRHLINSKDAGKTQSLSHLESLMDHSFKGTNNNCKWANVTSWCVWSACLHWLICATWSVLTGAKLSLDACTCNASSRTERQIQGWSKCSICCKWFCKFITEKEHFRRKCRVGNHVRMSTLWCKAICVTDWRRALFLLVWGCHFRNDSKSGLALSVSS